MGLLDWEHFLRMRKESPPIPFFRKNLILRAATFSRPLPPTRVTVPAVVAREVLAGVWDVRAGRRQRGEHLEVP